MRGLFENRIVADGVAWANVELRIKLFKFTFLNQYFYTAMNPFFDCGLVTQPYRLDRQAAAFGEDEKTCATQGSGPATAAGFGFKLAWNENFIVSARVGPQLRPRARQPDFWFDAGVNYVF